MGTTMRTGTLAGQLADAILYRYPQAWRERYDEEVRTLLRDVPAGWRDVCELFRGLLTERARELVGSDDRPKRTAFVLAALRPIFAAAFVALVLGVGTGLRELTGSWSDQVPEVWSWSLLGLLIAFLILLFRIRVRPRHGPHNPYPAWATIILLPALFVLSTVMVWGNLVGVSEYDRPRWMGYLVFWYNAAGAGLLAASLAGGLIPGRRLLFDFSHLAGIEERIRTYQRLVDGCHQARANGLSSPLAEVQRELERWTRERDAVRARLHAGGYRARFRHVEVGPADDADRGRADRG